MTAPEHILPVLIKDAIFAFLDDSLQSGSRCASRLFLDLNQIIECKSRDQIDQCFQRLSEALAAGLFAVGMFSYELGYCFERKLNALARADSPDPLFTVLLFDKCLRLDAEQSTAFVERNVPAEGLAAFHDIRLNMSKEAYCEAVGAIRRYIREGDVYQVNLTFKYLFRHFGSPFALYRALRSRQRVQYGAFIRLPNASVLSLSPELFIRKNGDTLTGKPMKGTIRRGETPRADELLMAQLHDDAKNRAENVMIVDLIRNDLGRIADLGSVAVERLFEVEPYETLFQMTSTITARTDPLIPVRDLFAALHPCGSVTGAPKIRAMEIIRELEVADRGLYTGAIGYMLPNRDWCFNVAIRTLILREDGTGEMGTGSGITYDSEPDREYEECILKGRFLTGADPGFKLIESLHCNPAAGYRHLEPHLRRLKSSSEYFLFQCDIDAIRAALLDHARSLNSAHSYKTRLLLGKDGAFEIESAPLPADDAAAPVRTVMLSDKQTDSRQCLLYHKTSARQLYDSEYARLQKETGCYEVLFCNERGEITEGSRTNIFVQKEGRLLTPPVACGLLNGVMRQSILDDPGYNAYEKVLTPADLTAAERIFVTNSVRGMVEVRYRSTRQTPTDGAAA